MYTTAQEAVKYIKSNQNVFIHSIAAAPQELIRAMTERGGELKNVSLYQIHTEGEAPYAAPQYKEAFNIKALFVGPNVREAVQAGRGSYIPIFLSEASALFRRRAIPLDVALISVAPPDKHGFCSLGPSIDISLAAAESARLIIAQVNQHMPRTHGDGHIHVDDIDIMVAHDEPLPELHLPEMGPTERAIGRNVAALVDDGACLQMGIGAIPNAVLAALGNHKNLGVHSEMFADGVLPLIEKGVINGSQKVMLPGVIVSAFALGSQTLYDFIDDNPMVKLLDFEIVNNTAVIQQNPKVTAINSAIEIDLTGQVCADSIGSSIFSGVGGQMDFIRGASLSKGGKPIIALPATTRGGKSKIVSRLKQGAGVVTTRAHIHYVVTEFGAVDLYGKSINERIRLLTGIAHPDHREALAREAAEIWH
jgi:acyl-CoA hydrolase